MEHLVLLPLQSQKGEGVEHLALLPLHSQKGEGVEHLALLHLQLQKGEGAVGERQLVAREKAEAEEDAHKR